MRVDRVVAFLIAKTAVLAVACLVLPACNFNELAVTVYESTDCRLTSVSYPDKAEGAGWTLEKSGSSLADCEAAVAYRVKLSGLQTGPAFVLTQVVKPNVCKITLVSSYGHCAGEERAAGDCRGYREAIKSSEVLTGALKKENPGLGRLVLQDNKRLAPGPELKAQLEKLCPSK